ncbi:MAG: hypothetical protein HZA54_08380 [Planctomycetes bacterium]|nr:hypothetical protein [Planctomycetota bacterium]
MGTRNIVGNVPDPDELYGRRDLIDHLWRQLAGNNLLLVAPRRFGKTGVLRHVLEQPRPGYLPLYFELEDVDAPEEFVWRLAAGILSKPSLCRLLSTARKLPAALQQWAQRTFDDVEFGAAKVTFRSEIKPNWKAAATRLMTELEQADETLVLLLDELPAMIENLRRDSDATASEFLAWFRTARLQQKERLRRHRFVVAGSIGLDTVLRSLHSAHQLNDFERIYVGPISSSEAARLVDDLAKGREMKLGDELREHLLARIGSPVPYFIHLFFSQLGQLPAAERAALDRNLLDQVYRERILGPTCRQYFLHYRERLERYGKELERAAMGILGTVAGAPNGRATRSTLEAIYRRCRRRGRRGEELDELLADLEHDWYLALDGNTNEYHFKVDVMRDWWLRWFPSTARARAATEGRT